MELYFFVFYDLAHKDVHKLRETNDAEKQFASKQDRNVLT